MLSPEPRALLSRNNHVSRHSALISHLPPTAEKDGFNVDCPLSLSSCFLLPSLLRLTDLEIAYI